MSQPEPPKTADVKTGLSNPEEMPKCTKCEDRVNVIKIVYGYPAPALLEESTKGNVRLGGCCPTPNMKYFFCKACNLEF